MKAAVKVDERKELLIMEVPMPELKPTDVLLKVHTAGLCGTDVAIRNNTFMGRHGPVKYPIIPGHEFFGTVVEVGPRVNKFKVGDRAFTDCAVGCGECYECKTGKICKKWIHWGIDVDGGFAEYVAVHQDALLHVPEFVKEEHAAIMEIASEATKAIRINHIVPGSVIAIFGPGSFGQFMIQTMKLTSPRKLIVVGLSSDKERLKLAQKMGATDIIVADEEDPAEKIMELTKGRGADYVVEVTGNPDAITHCVDSLSVCGHLIVAGSGFRGKNTYFKPWNFVRNENKISTIQGFGPADYEHMLDLYAAGMLDFDAVISDVRPLEDVNECCDLAEKKEVLKIVLRP